jgi:hypothetical protein
MDRRLARQVALAILEVCGPAEEEPADLATADVLTAVYDEEGVITGFAPYVGTPAAGGPQGLLRADARRQGLPAQQPPGDRLPWLSASTSTTE